MAPSGVGAAFRADRSDTRPFAVWFATRLQLSRAVLYLSVLGLPALPTCPPA